MQRGNEHGWGLALAGTGATGEYTAGSGPCSRNHTSSWVKCTPGSHCSPGGSAGRIHGMDAIQFLSLSQTPN